MNIKQNLLGASALLLAALATSVNASTMTINSPADVNVGDTFQVEIFGDFGTDSFLSGGVDFSWDDSLVSLDNVTLNIQGPIGLDCPGSTAPECTNGTTADTTSIAWVGFFAALIPADAGSTLMATLDFTANAGGSAGFSMANNTSLTEGNWFDGNNQAIAVPSFGTSSTTIAAIPVPAAVWLFGSGLLGLVGVARRRKAA